MISVPNCYPLVSNDNGITVDGLSPEMQKSGVIPVENRLGMTLFLVRNPSGKYALCADDALSPELSPTCLCRFG